MSASTERSDTNTGAKDVQHHTAHEETVPHIDPRDPAANEAAKIIQQAYRKYHEQQEEHEHGHHQQNKTNSK